jgi:hypothetical protein
MENKSMMKMKKEAVEQLLTLGISGIWSLQVYITKLQTKNAK